MAEGKSLSSRRAWIEIGRAGRKHAEKQSLSSRRAWIEILVCLSLCGWFLVALLAEGVD